MSRWTWMNEYYEKKQKTSQSDFPKFIGIYFTEYTLCLLLLEKIH